MGCGIIPSRAFVFCISKPRGWECHRPASGPLVVSLTSASIRSCDGQLIRDLVVPSCGRSGRWSCFLYSPKHLCNMANTRAIDSTPNWPNLQIMSSRGAQAESFC